MAAIYTQTAICNDNKLSEGITAKTSHIFLTRISLNSGNTGELAFSREELAFNKQAYFQALETCCSYVNIPLEIERTIFKERIKQSSLSTSSLVFSSSRL